VAALFFAPLTYGAVEAWSQMILAGLVFSALLAIRGDRTVRAGDPWRGTWSYLPIVLFFGLVLIQLTPLPANWIGLVSPHTVELKQSLLADLNRPAAAPLTFSFYSLATVQQLRLMLIVTAVFVLVLQLAQSRSAIRRVLLAVTGVGVMVGLIALYQNVTGAAPLLSLFPDADANSGTFVNHSHFGQFMNLTLGAGLGLWLMNIHHRRAAHDPAGRWEIGLLSAFLVIGALLVLLSLTRGGLVAMLICAWRACVISIKRRVADGNCSAI
jgi:hypothetical protein